MEPRLDEIVRDAIRHANGSGAQYASFGVELCDRIAFALECAGDVLDALRDEMRLVVGENHHVADEAIALARILGGGYHDYLEGWD